MYVDEDFEKQEKGVRFHEFVVETYTYTNKKGEKKTGSRTIRKEFVEEFHEFKSNIDSKRSAYLLHRYEIKNDSFHWPQIMSDTDLGIIFHQDYSENISCSPKFEP